MFKFIVVMLIVSALLSLSVVVTALEQGSAFMAGMFVVFAVVAGIAAVLFARYAGE